MQLTLRNPFKVTHSHNFSSPKNTPNNYPIHEARNWFNYGIATNMPITEQMDPLFLPLSSYSRRVAPKYSYKEMIEAYETFAEISFGLDWITSVSVGRGHYFTAVDSRVENHVNEFAENINLDAMLFDSTKEELGYGDSFWRYRDLLADPKYNDILEHMPLTSFQAIHWDRSDFEASYYHFIGRQNLYLKPAELIHFKWRTSNASPLGLGLLAPLIVRKKYTIWKGNTSETRIRMPLVDIFASIQDTAHKIMKRYVPRYLYELTDADPQQRKDAESQLETLNDEQDIVVDGPTKTTEIGARARTVDLDTFDALYRNEIIKALGTPVARLYDKGALTEASAKTAKEVALMNLEGYLRHKKRMIERLVIKPWYMANPITDANGVFIPWTESHIRLNWGVQEKPKITLQEFARLLEVAPGVFHREEIRDNLRKKYDIIMKSPEEEAQLKQEQPRQDGEVPGL